MLLRSSDEAQGYTREPRVYRRDKLLQSYFHAHNYGCGSSGGVLWILDETILRCAEEDIIVSWAFCSVRDVQCRAIVVPDKSMQVSPGSEPSEAIRRRGRLERKREDASMAASSGTIPTEERVVSESAERELG